MKIDNIHDKFVKGIFDETRNAIDFFQNYLPEEIVKILDLSKIKKCSETFVSEKLKDHYTDILFEIPRIDSNEVFFLHALFEHKSYPDENIHKQLLNYQTQIQLSQKETVSILSVVFYNGKKSWKPDTRFEDHYKNKEDSLSKYLLNFEYIYIDINELNLAKTETNEHLYLDLYLMKNNHSEDFEEKLIILFRKHKEFIVSKIDTKFLSQFLIYAIETSEINSEGEKKFVDFLSNEVSNKLKEVFMTTAERWRTEGRLEGRLEDARKMISKGFSINDILEITSLTKDHLIEAGLLKN